MRRFAELSLRRCLEFGKAGAHFGEACGMGRVLGKIVFLAWVLGQIEELLEC
jgi:hypothetical protein